MEPNLAAFDIETAANEGAKLELLDKHGRKSGEWILLLGADSKAYQDRIGEQNRNRLQRLARTNQTAKLNQEEMEGEMIERLVLCTKDWSFKTQDDQKFPCTPENISKIYRKSTIIREQVIQFINDRANFLSD